MRDPLERAKNFETISAEMSTTTTPKTIVCSPYPCVDMQNDKNHKGVCYNGV